MSAAQNLALLFADFEEETVLRLVRERLKSGEEPLELIEECRQGMRIVGERYEEGSYYISALIMAGQLLREVLEIIGPHLTENLRAHPLAQPLGSKQPRQSDAEDITAPAPATPPTLLLCTVKGDIHDIGKDIAASLFQAHGFVVVDLGVNVDPTTVAAEVVARRPNVFGLSGLLSEAFESMRITVEAIREGTAGWQASVPVILGGSPVNQKVCDYARADLWCNDALEGVRQVVNLLESRRQR